MARTLICIFGGSSQKTPHRIAEAARRFGRLAARRGWVLRTGGGSGKSIMGLVTDGALEEGGRVEGVILKKFWSVRHTRLHSLRSESDFPRRKAGVIRGTAAVVCFPGGVGTLDELTDVMGLRQHGFLRVPVVLLNLDGFYDGMLKWLSGRVRRDTFIGKRELRTFRPFRSVDAAVRFLDSRLKK